MSEQSTLATAIHEAGHAVACFRLFPDRMTGTLSILRNRDDGLLGSHESEKILLPRSTGDDDAERIFESDAVYTCAGYGAMIAKGFPEEEAIVGCEQDFEEARPRLNAAKVKAVELMSSTENIKAVSRLAEELMRFKSMQPDHVEVVIELTQGECSETEYREFLGHLGLV